MGDNNEIIRFEWVQPDRQSWSLMYLSDHVEHHPGPNQFSGGAVSFNFLFDRDGNMLVIKPEKGLCVSFPSNPVFSHQGYPVDSGCRIAIVDWRSAEIYIS